MAACSWQCLWQSGVWQALVLSLKVAACACLLDMLLGALLGYLLARRRFVGRELLDSLLTLPLVLPPTVLGYYLLVLLGREGVFGQWLAQFGIRLVFSWQGAVLAAAVVCLPLMVKAARQAFETVPQAYEQAAQALGVDGWARFCRITLPLAWRGLLSGVLLVFARALGEFGATLMIAGAIPGQTQTLSLAVYEAVQAGRDDLAQLLVLLLSLCAVLVLLALGWLGRTSQARAYVQGGL